MAAPSAAPPVGGYIGPYQILGRLGAGAMGEVVLGLDERLDRKVAIKLLTPAQSANPELRERFVREARAMAGLNHPHIVQVHAIDAHAGIPFFVMEYLPGKDLGALVRARTRLTAAEALPMALDAARGLAEASNHHIIHRDVKPSNLLLGERGEVKVTDFGLAKQLMDPALTRSGIVLGTPDYIAPEQARGEALEARTDVYALGCTLFHLLSGRPPYRRPGEDKERYMQVVSRHLSAPVPDLAEEVPDVPTQVASLCRWMMSKRLTERPDYPELLASLANLCGQRQPAPPSVELAADASAAQQTSPAAAGPAPIPRWAVLATAASALLFIVSICLVLYQTARNAQAHERAVLGAPASGGADRGLPAGFLRVEPRGRPPVYVSARVVSYAELDRIMPPPLPAPQGEEEKPAVGVSYADAADYALRTEARLVDDAEWAAASILPGFVPAGPRMCEWVSGGSPRPGHRSIRCADGRRELAEGAAERYVTFRVARPVPATQ